MKTIRVLLVMAMAWLIMPASVSAFYNPSTGRWLSRDRIDEFGGLNIYGAVQNDSVNRVDPRGNMIWNPPRVVASCLPCICRDVKITFDPGGAKFEWGITSNPYDSKALKKLGNNIKVEWKVLGSCKNCKYSQDETAAVMATGFSRDDPTDAINNTFGGLVGTEHDAGGLDTETCSYMDRMGQDLDDLGYFYIKIKGRIVFKCTGSDGKQVSKTWTFDAAALAIRPLPPSEPRVVRTRVTTSRIE